MGCDVHFLVFVACVYGSQTDSNKVGKDSDVWTCAADAMHAAYTQPVYDCYMCSQYQQTQQT